MMNLIAHPPGERRSHVRQKLHSPVYASFGPHTGMVVDLTELLDLHEEGFAVQTREMLEVNRPLALTLDLPETRKFIHGSGQVMWSGPSGRGGIRFSALPESSQQLLKEWLFANLLIACSNHAARSEQFSGQPEKAEEIPHEPLPSAEPSGPTPSLDLSDMLSAMDEVRGAGADRDTVFQLITAHALRLTGASGAALAFLTDGNMICRARAGEPAPQLGAPVDRKQGLSGECVRSALIVGCQDTKNDSRVAQEICRALGIGSMLAVPIFSGFRVVGLLEVFSSHPRTFTKAHETVLERLVEALPEAHPEPPMRQDAATGELLPPSSYTDSSVHEVLEAPWESEPEIEAETDAQAPQVRVLRFGVFELDPRAGELRKKGMKIRLQGQPVDILAMLLQHPLISPEIRAKLERQFSSADFSRRRYLGLMALVFATVSIVLGYLLAWR